MIDSCHLWLTFRSNKDPLSLLLLWWWTYYISQLCLGSLYFHRKRCNVSCFTCANSCFFIIFNLVFSFVGWCHVIGWWYLHFGQYGYCQSRLSKFDFTCCFISWSDHNDTTQIKEEFYRDGHSMNLFFSLAIIFFDCLHQ
jgi:hypothetical protein